MTHPLVSAASATIVLTLAPMALALPADTPAQPEPAPATPLLSGPSVEPEASAPTLIRLGYDGRIERIDDTQPEVAALHLIDLPDDARARIDASLEERAAFLDAAVLEHYETLLELYAAFGAGDQTEVIGLYMEFASHLQPLFEGGGLGRQLAREMPQSTAREYARLLREYYAALTQDVLAHSEEAQGNPPVNAADALRQHKVQLLMEEVGRSFARIIEQKTQEFEEVLDALDLDPDREAEIRSMVEVMAGDFGLNPTEAQKRQLFTRIMQELTPEERQKLLGWVLR